MTQSSTSPEDKAEAIARRSLLLAERIVKKHRIDPDLVEVAVHPQLDKTILLLDRRRGSIPEVLWQALLIEEQRLLTSESRRRAEDEGEIEGHLGGADDRAIEFQRGGEGVCKDEGYLNAEDIGAIKGHLSAGNEREIEFQRGGEDVCKDEGYLKAEDGGAIEGHLSAGNEREIEFQRSGEGICKNEGQLKAEDGGAIEGHLRGEDEREIEGQVNEEDVWKDEDHLSEEDGGATAGHRCGEDEGEIQETLTTHPLTPSTIDESNDSGAHLFTDVPATAEEYRAQVLGEMTERASIDFPTSTTSSAKEDSIIIDPLDYDAWPQYLKDRTYPVHVPAREELGRRRSEIGEQGLAVCWLRNCLRVTDNAALDLATFLSRTLVLRLQVIVLTERAIVEDVMRPEKSGSASLRRQSQCFLQAVCSLFSQLEICGIPCNLLESKEGAEPHTIADTCASAYALIIDDAFLPGDGLILAQVTERLPCLPALMVECGCVPKLRQCPPRLYKNPNEYHKWWHDNVDLLARKDTTANFEILSHNSHSRERLDDGVDIQAIRLSLESHRAGIQVTDDETEEFLNLLTKPYSSDETKLKNVPDLLLLHRIGVISPYTLLEHAPTCLDDVIEEYRGRSLCLENEGILIDGTDASKLHWLKLFTPPALEDKAQGSIPQAQLFPKDVINGCTNDSVFNRIQRELVLTGKMHQRDSFIYWVAFLLRSLPSWRLAVRHALLQIACHSVMSPRLYPVQCVKVILAAEAALLLMQNESGLDTALQDLRLSATRELLAP